jgi:hypothetical protein
MSNRTVRVSLRSVSTAIARSRGISPTDAQRLADDARRDRARRDLGAAEPVQPAQPHGGFCHSLAEATAILASEQGISLEQARVQAVQRGYRPAVEAPRSLRAVTKILTDRGVPLAVAQERAERIVAAEDARRAIAASGVRRTAQTHAGALPVVRTSTSQLARQIMKRTGVSYEIAQQMADAVKKRLGQTPKLTVSGLAKQLQETGLSPADALRAAELQLGRKLEDDDVDQGGGDDVDQRAARDGGTPVASATPPQLPPAATSARQLARRIMRAKGIDFASAQQMADQQLASQRRGSK